MTSNDDFFARLPAVTDFRDVADPAHHHPVPPDWYVLVADVEGSTAAVEAGRYRTVNFVGAACIAAALNAAAPVALPFVFGGDGATLLAPASCLPALRRALTGMQRQAEAAYGLRLRAGAVPVADLYAAGHTLTLCRYAPDPGYAQAILLGDGLPEAERRIKDPVDGRAYRFAPEPGLPAPDCTGIECRWRPIRARHGETVTLLVEALGPDVHATYRRVLDAIDRCYGPEADRRPVVADRLRASFSLPYLHAMEPKVRVPEAPLRRLAYTLKIWFQQFLLLLFIRFDVRTGPTRWRDYPGRIEATTDHRKLDAVLRMVLQGPPEARTALQAFLEAERKKGTLRYGLHVADSALMTCLVYERMGAQVHFVDGAGGGYTRAARMLKAQAAPRDQERPGAASGSVT
ncbi:MAG: DUF3095 domain-containing protein [Bacteroidetes bacterium]|nr:MAG: DUF3095 domain-containing protein [Bacteroidota bacterium]